MISGILQNVPSLIGRDVLQSRQHRVGYIRASVRKAISMPVGREFNPLFSREQVELAKRESRERKQREEDESNSIHSHSCHGSGTIVPQNGMWPQTRGEGTTRQSPEQTRTGMRRVVAEKFMTTSGTTRVRWLLVFWLFVLSAVSYLDRVNISIAGGAIVDAYHLTDVQLGKVFSALVAGYALFQTIGGQLADRFGPRRVLTGGVIWWGIFTALTALVPANFAGALASLYGGPFSAGSRRGRHLSGGEPVCLALDPRPRARNCEWMDLCRRGRGRWAQSSSHHLPDDSLRMEIVVLGVRGSWIGRRSSVVPPGAGHARRASERLAFRTRNN